VARPPASDEDRAKERRRIRQAAAAIHREEGIRAITVRAIAERAGISTGKIYSYFGSLGELMRSLWTEPVASLNETLAAVAEAEPDPAARIGAILTTYLEFARTNDDTYRGAFLFVRPKALAADEQRPASDVPLLEFLGSAIADGQADGSIRSGPPEELAKLLWSGLHGAIALPINADLYALDPSERLAPAMVDLLVSAIRS